MAICCIVAMNGDRTAAADIVCSERSTQRTCVVIEPIKADDDLRIQYNQSFTQVDQIDALELKAPSSINVIPSVIFSTFPLLHALDFPNASVQSVSPATFENASQLQKLNLHGNEIRTLPGHAFSHASNLTRIDLSWNKIVSIEDYALDGLANLTELNLNGNRIGTLRQHALTAAKSLFTLRLESNDLETIEDGALNLPALGELLLAQNKLKSLSDNWLDQAPSVSIVDVGCNQLTRIGQAFSNIRNLSILILDNNPIGDLNITRLAALEKLNGLSLNNTGLKLFAEDLHNADTAASKSPLARLNLSYNNLTTGNIFKYLSAFNQLNVLFLDNNELTHLHDTFKIRDQFPTLNIISLMNNPICDWLQDNIDIFRRDEIIVYYSCSTIY